MRRNFSNPFAMIPQKEEKNVQSIDQVLNTDKITPKLVQYIVDKIVREIQPEKIILFGSYARGDFSGDRQGTGKILNI
jgi:predicted nucleotidyltransferase